MEVKELTIERLQQQAHDMRKAAKELQRKMQEVTDSEERKQLARRMNELFAEASSLRDESIERDFRCIETDLED